MKLNTILTSVLLTLTLSLISLNTIQAQTQAEIEAMSQEDSAGAKGKEKKTDAEKQAEKELKAAQKEIEKAQNAENKAAKEAEKAEKKTGEKVKEAKTEKTPKVKKTKLTKSTASSSNIMNKPLKTWSIDLGINVTNPQTDIRYNDFFGTMTPKNEYKYGGQLRVTKMFDNAIGIQAQFAYNRLQGVFDTLVPYKEDRDAMAAAGISEGIYFKNNVIQGSLNLYWNISNTVFNINKFYRSLNSKKPIKPRIFSLYAYSGIGFSIFDPHVMRLSDNVTVEDASVFPGVEFKTNRTTEVVVPLALGAKFKLSKTIDLGLEYGYNFMFSDKLDGMNYNHPGRLKADGYTHGSLVLTMKLGSKKNAKEHIEWSNSLEPVFQEIAKIGAIKKKVDKLARDEDEDGVSDYFDKDTETPEGATVGADGRILDTDGDGVNDDKDMELFTAKGAEVDEQGRALDTDGDGVPDHRDMEDGTSKNQFVNFQGKSIDDNITIKEDDGGIKNIALPSIFFDTDRSNIKREFEDELFLMALTIKRNKDLRFVLEGHCDERGSDEYNEALGNKRAEVVKAYLVENYKLDPALFTIVSKGRAEALSPKYNVNRRVDIILAE